ncbi:maleylpyruvate isomerase family mycothiol-dependent enzyme [Pseudonocardia humida]|uniref:Maleylpyruvate isomerase family mycothiol-dependent enzyme n=1 Tax=Pseudonocardia humida TaxID=2800819 RepID=A0ABT1AE62_9PSEU|nr:maleylpyruvate isomerase family mycothiol-dependent enzyme [Pseudonocardia humida]MCO1661109.1 maleylpyruvate isomerase family mycothiol-dependent enzyme [Pseudonocardia humida]
MDRDEHWATIAHQRRELADLLDDLTDDEWEQPSLCAQWRVRDVVAHLVLTPQPPSPARLLAGAVRVRGDFDRLNRDLAVTHATATPAHLVAQLREHTGSRRRPVVTTYRNLHFDVLVHVQDIAVPLGRSLPMPVDAARAGVERVWTMGWPFHARRTLADLRLAATDTDWAVGDGLEVHGPTEALLLLVTGRTAAALPRLSGPGVARLVIRTPEGRG